MSWVGAAIVTSSLIGAQAAKSAAGQQADAARQAAELQQRQFETINEQQKPYREAGYTALGDIANLKDYLTSQFTPEAFRAGLDPGYAFRLQQGQEAANRMANLSGGLMGGNAMRGLQDYTQGLASQEYQNAFNRFQTQRSNIYNTLASIAGLGQTSLGQTTQAGVQTAQNVGQNLANVGAAQAGGTVGAANALSGGLQQYANQQYLSQLLAPRSQVPSGYTDTSGFSGGGSGILHVPGEGTMPISDFFKTQG